MLRGVGLPVFRVYDLRHTFASLLLARNAPITYVAAQLGHGVVTKDSPPYKREGLGSSPGVTTSGLGTLLPMVTRPLTKWAAQAALKNLA